MKRLVRALLLSLLNVGVALSGVALAQPPAKKQGSPLDGLLRSVENSLQKLSGSPLPAMAKDDGYRLGKDENLRHIALPFPERRAEYDHFLRPIQDNSQAISFTFSWEDNTLVRGASSWGTSPEDGIPLQYVLTYSLGIPRYLIEPTDELPQTPVTGDWIVRKGASREQLVKELNTILRMELKLPIQLELREDVRPVYVVSGSYKFTPYPDEDAKQPAAKKSGTGAAKIVEVFGSEMFANHRGINAGTYADFIDELSEWTNTPIVSEVRQPPTKYLAWRYHLPPNWGGPGDPDRDPELVLPNITDQTGLEFNKQDRKITILFIEVDP